MLKKEQFDSLLEELVSEETTEGRKSLIAVDLIKDYAEGLEEINKLQEYTTQAQAEKELLQRANVNLFRQQLSGYKEEKEQPKHKLTLEEIEQRHRKF